MPFSHVPPRNPFRRCGTGFLPPPHSAPAAKTYRQPLAASIIDNWLSQPYDHIIAISTVASIREDPYPGSYGFDYLVSNAGDSAMDIKEKDSPLPQGFALEQNYPNPFNPTTSISFSIGQRAHVELTVYNLLGQMIRVLVDEIKSAGNYTAVWDGTDHTGRLVGSGIYFYRLKAENSSAVRRMLLLK